MKSRTIAFGVSLALATALSFPSAAAFPDDEKAIVHVLNRIGFGARPGDMERVRAIGLQRYIEQQLHPDQIDDKAVAARLAGLTTITLSSRDISEKFEQPLMEARRERKQAAAADANAPRDDRDPARVQVQQRANAVIVELAEQKLLRAVYSDRQLQEVLTDFWFNHFNVDARKGRDRFLLTEYERDTIRPRVLGSFRELLGATAKSPAMLFYLDNWLSADPNGPHPPAARSSTLGRQPAFGGRGRGRFQAPMPAAPRPNPAQPANGRRSGLNENYARELMELHTLGVDGGYTQKDVTEVARAFTGWTIDNPRQGGSFRFEERVHDPGAKTVLGRTIKAGGGIRDGEQVLDLLASHPSTARFISTKLARRFVSDAPPPALVERMAARFRETGGDLRAVMALLLTSPEFLSPDAYRSKVKTPFEFVVSAVRATGADVVDARPLVRSLQDLGMPLYQCQPPTGYKDTADAWTNTGALIGRMNFAVALTSGRMPQPQPPPGGLSSPRAQDQGRGRAGPFGGLGRGFVNAAPSALDTWEAAVEVALAHDISEATRATIAKSTTTSQRVALALGSPEFQRR
jgi:uncharacterized protein (DUF1800 family)